MNANPVEIAWTILAVGGAVITLMNFLDAYSEWRVMLAAPDHHGVLGIARSVVARANARREAVRLVIQCVFIALVIPAVQRPGDTPLTPWILLLMSLPILMVINSYLDGRVRANLRRMTGLR